MNSFKSWVVTASSVGWGVLLVGVIFGSELEILAGAFLVLCSLTVLCSLLVGLLGFSLRGLESGPPVRSMSAGVSRSATELERVVAAYMADDRPFCEVTPWDRAARLEENVWRAIQPAEPKLDPYRQLQYQHVMQVETEAEGMMSIARGSTVFFVSNRLSARLVLQKLTLDELDGLARSRGWTFFSVATRQNKVDALLDELWPAR